MNSREVSSTSQAAVYTGTRQVTSITHTHDEEMFEWVEGLGVWKAEGQHSLIRIWEESEMGKECADRRSRLIYSDGDKLRGGRMCQEERARINYSAAGGERRGWWVSGVEGGGV